VRSRTAPLLDSDNYEEYYRNFVVLKDSFFSVSLFCVIHLVLI